jgi:hypothetical protein
MAYRKVLAMQKQWSLEIVRCIHEWANGGDDNEMIESVRSSLNESVNQWVNDSVIQWMSQRIDESMKQ